jgi:Poly(3-hydroxyalkanoate) synthetase
VRERPLLIVPPCINKFYILDLQPENSLVAHGLDSGHQVFLISWRNADASIASKTWDDYIGEGVLKAIETVSKISGREQINTLVSAWAAPCSPRRWRWRQRAASIRRVDDPAHRMLDFSDTGVLDVSSTSACADARADHRRQERHAPA